MKLVLRLVCLSLVIAAAALAAEGFSLVDKTTLHASNRVTTTRVFIEPTRVAVNSEGAGKKTSMVFLADQEIIRIIDHSGRKYHEMTRQDIEKLGNQMNEMMQKMQEQLKNLPPQQRAMMEKMMKGKMPGAAQQVEKTVYTAAGSGEVGGRTCARYEGRRAGKKHDEVCTVAFSEFGAKIQDFAVFRKLGDLFAKLSPKNADEFLQFGGDDWEQQQGYPGIPIERKTFSNGKLVSTHVVETVERMEIPEDVFTVPAGYKKQKGFAQMGGR